MTNPTYDSSNLLPILLHAVRIVMVNTTLPANIGSAARAMHTMGLSELIIVDPKHPIDDTSLSHAASGQAILNNSRVVDTLDESIENCQLIFAASSRNRHIPRPVVTPTQAAQIIKRFIAAQSVTEQFGTISTDTTPTYPKVAILFGREDRGLTNEELAKADYHIQIDANPDYPVLNVASAIQVIASFLYASFSSDSNEGLKDGDDESTQSKSNNYIAISQRQQWDAPPIDQQQKQHLQNRLIDLMVNLDLVNSADSSGLRELPNRLSRLTSRLQLDQKEFQLINAIIAKLNKKL